MLLFNRQTCGIAALISGVFAVLFVFFHLSMHRDSDENAIRETQTIMNVLISTHAEYVLQGGNPVRTSKDLEVLTPFLDRINREKPSSVSSDWYQFVSNKGIKFEDGWNRKLSVVVPDMQTGSAFLVSSGSDGILSTRDDIQTFLVGSGKLDKNNGLEP